MTFREPTANPPCCRKEFADHCEPIDRGQGLNNAIIDAASLGRQIRDNGVKLQSAVVSALATYEPEVWERGKEAVLPSLENSMATHNWEILMN